MSLELYEKLKSKYPYLDFSHTKDRESFREYYNEQGKKSLQLAQELNRARMSDFNGYFKDPLIELGSHAGFNAPFFVENGCNDITLVDCSENYIAEAIYRYGSSPRIKFICSMIEDLPEDKKYKTIVLTETLEHVLDPNEILKKCKNILDEDGIICITTPSERIGSEAHLRGFNKEDMTKFLNFHHLEVIKFFRDGTDGTKLIARHTQIYDNI